MRWPGDSAPHHAQHCHSASPSGVAVLVDQVLGHTLRIHPPVLWSQVLAGNGQETCKSHERTLRTGPGRRRRRRSVGWEGALGGPGLPSSGSGSCEPPGYALVLQYKSTPGKKVSVVGWMVQLPDDPEHPDIFQLNNPDKGRHGPGAGRPRLLSALFHLLLDARFETAGNLWLLLCLCFRF